MKTISVAWYHNAALYRFMPRAMFDALEAAFLVGNETTEVPEALYDEFINALPSELCRDILPMP